MVLALPSWADVVLRHVTVDAVLQADGSVRMTEVWDADVNSTKHRELYQTRSTRGISIVEDLTVSDQGREFTTLNEWDTEAPDMEDRCGILPVKGGYELCWGIGQPGHHRYRLDYIITSVLQPSGTDNVALNLVLFHGMGLLPVSVTATISRADSVLTDDDVLQFEPSKDNTVASFDKGHFTLKTERPMARGDLLGAYIEFPATAFGEIDRTALNNDIAPDEMASPMMLDKTAEKYEESWSAKFWDFYDEWPVLTLFSILGALIVLFYVVRKIAIALV